MVDATWRWGRTSSPHARRHLGARRAALQALLLGLAVSLAGCGDFWEGCSDLDGPRFETPGLPSATELQPYDAVVSVDIVRNPLDEMYGYSFDVDGDVPPGLQVQQGGASRRLRLFGVPTTAGTYSFKVSVHVTDYSTADDQLYTLCWTDEEKTYVIVVDAAPS